MNQLNCYLENNYSIVKYFKDEEFKSFFSNKFINYLKSMITYKTFNKGKNLDMFILKELEDKEQVQELKLLLK